MTRRESAARADAFGIVYDFDRTLLTLSGEVDAAANGLTDLVQAAVDRRLPVDVDVSGVTIMDSTGCGLLARLVTGVRPARVRVRGASPEVAVLLRRLQMHTVLDLEERCGESPA